MLHCRSAVQHPILQKKTNGRHPERKRRNCMPAAPLFFFLHSRRHPSAAKDLPTRYSIFFFSNRRHPHEGAKGDLGKKLYACLSKIFPKKIKTHLFIFK
jgi:hypothetical protein